MLFVFMMFPSWAFLASQRAMTCTDGLMASYRPSCWHVDAFGLQFCVQPSLAFFEPTCEKMSIFHGRDWPWISIWKLQPKLWLPKDFLQRAPSCSVPFSSGRHRRYQEVPNKWSAAFSSMWSFSNIRRWENSRQNSKMLQKATEPWHVHISWERIQVHALRRWWEQKSIKFGLHKHEQLH